MDIKKHIQFQIETTFSSNQYFKQYYDLTELQFEVLWYRYLVKHQAKYIIIYKQQFYIGYKPPNDYKIRQQKNKIILLNKTRNITMHVIDKISSFQKEINSLKRYNDPLNFLRKKKSIL
jgi:hypothetical protein